MTRSPFHHIGSALVLANRNATRSDLHRRQGLNERLNSADGDIFQREVCKIAAAAYEVDGLAGSVPGQLFQKLASTDKWCAAYNKFTTPVISAIGRFAAREIELQKSAAAMAALPFAANQVGIPSVVKLLLGLGAIGGVGAGSLGFLLSRDARQSSAENAALSEKTRAYKQLRRDIEEDLAVSGALEEERPTSKRYSL